MSNRFECRTGSTAMAQTLREIAKQLNLSVSTVSYAINGGPKPVSVDVKRKVLRKAREMGYRPNRIAKSLSTGRTHTIGVVPMYVNQDTPLLPFTVAALNGIIVAANEMRQDVMMFTAFDRNRPTDATNDFLDSRADGLIFIAPRPSSPSLHSISESSLPFAVLYEDCVGPSFTVDNESAVHTVLEHLTALGHRRIAHIAGPQESSDGRRRKDAFVTWMADHGLPVPDEYLFNGDYGRESGIAAGREFLTMSSRPTGICPANDDMTRGFLEILRDHGVRCPEEVSVAGCDCLVMPGAEEPTFTACQQPVQTIAAEALRAVVRQIETGEAVKSAVFRSDFVIRRTTGPVPKEGIIR